MESEEFLLLPVIQLVDVISSDELNVRSEEQVYSAVMSWVRYNIQERRPSLPMVRISDMSSRSAASRTCASVREWLSCKGLLQVAESELDSIPA